MIQTVHNLHMYSVESNEEGYLIKKHCAAVPSCDWTQPKGCGKGSWVDDYLLVGYTVWKRTLLHLPLYLAYKVFSYTLYNTYYCTSPHLLQRLGTSYHTSSWVLINERLPTGWTSALPASYICTLPTGALCTATANNYPTLKSPDIERDTPLSAVIFFLREPAWSYFAFYIFAPSETDILLVASLQLLLLDLCPFG